MGNKEKDRELSQTYLFGFYPHDMLHIIDICNSIHMGTTEVQLPDLEFMTQELSGAGIGGKIDEIVTGNMMQMGTLFSLPPGHCPGSHPQTFQSGRLRFSRLPTCCLTIR